MDDYVSTDMREASRRLSESLFDSYESDWVGEEDLGAIVEVSMITSANIKTRTATALHFLLEQKQQDSHIARGPKPLLSPSLYT